jgi:hypothetical protein
MIAITEAIAARRNLIFTFPSVEFTVLTVMHYIHGLQGLPAPPIPAPRTLTRCFARRTVQAVAAAKRICLIVLPSGWRSARTASPGGPRPAGLILCRGMPAGLAISGHAWFLSGYGQPERPASRVYLTAWPVTVPSSPPGSTAAGVQRRQGSFRVSLQEVFPIAQAARAHAFAAQGPRRGKIVLTVPESRW